MILIDTDLLTHAFYKHPKIGPRVEAACRRDELRVPSSVFCEMLTGRIAAVQKAATGTEILVRQQRLIETIDFLGRFTLVWFDEAAREVFDRLRSLKALHKVGAIDIRIASQALAQPARLATRNTTHFSLIPGLKIEDWMK